jgi:GTPase SAR1 family protein
MDSFLMWVIIGGIVAALVGVFFVFVSKYGKLADALDESETKVQSNVELVKRLHEKIATLEAENKRQLGWLDAQTEELNWHKGELDKRPVVDRKIYRILTVGMKATGKSSLTLKWANPLVDLGSIEGTKIERYERTVSQVRTRDSLVEHVFEVHDWGGEHIVDAQQELIMEEIQGILMVVDLGGKDARQIDQHRIMEQLDEFNPKALKFFFSPKTVASCKTIVLFINKSDLIPGTPAQAEAHAKQYYAPLIDSLMQYATHIDVKVMVGSASFGHSTHVLFSHFVEQILPKAAYDPQLLQRIKGDPRQRSRTTPPGMNGPSGGMGGNGTPLPAPHIPHALPQSNGHGQAQASVIPLYGQVTTPINNGARPPKVNMPLNEHRDAAGMERMENTVPLNRKPPAPTQRNS